MKKLFIIICFIFTLVACDKPDLEPTPEEIFNQKMASVIENKNYKMEFSVKDYVTLKTTTVVYLYDDNKSQVIDGSKVEFYEHASLRTKKYYQTPDGYKVQTMTKQDNNFFKILKYDMFTELDGQYLMDYNAHEEVSKFFDGSEDKIEIENLALDFKDDKVDQLLYTMKINDISYLVTMKFLDYGNIAITLPEVQ